LAPNLSFLGGQSQLYLAADRPAVGGRLIHADAYFGHRFVHVAPAEVILSNCQVFGSPPERALIASL
jgi:hypothetical protein